MYHEPLLIGSFPLIGLAQIPSRRPPASAALPDAAAALVDKDVEGDKDGVVDGDPQDASSSSSWSPPSDLANAWESLVGISSTDSWEESKSLGPSISALTRRWSAPESGFRPLRRDLCLHAQFEKLAKESKLLMDFALSSMAASSAAAHAVLHAAAFVGEFVRNLSSVSPDPAWASFCEDAVKAVTLDALHPLRDASLGLAHVFGRAASSIWSGVICHANSAIQPVLRSSPPSSGFFFGDPAAQVTSSNNLAVMSSLVQRQCTPASRGFFRRPAAPARGS